MEKVNIHQILTDLGYKLKDHGKEYRTRPLYRESNNETVLKIYKDTGHWFDFKENISGDFNSLINLTLKLDSVDKAKEWLKDKNFDLPISTHKGKPLLKQTKKFDIDLLNKLKNDQNYWMNRGVSFDTLIKFKGGVAENGKMKNRYVFPIFNLNNQIIGFSGRDITNKSKIKWKHIGEKKDWIYPLHINKDPFNEKEIFLVESIGDCLSMWDAGVTNTVVTFGLDISISILNFLLRSDFKKINISFNNDLEKNSAGNIAAKKSYNKLLRYFDKNQLNIKLPTKKDFGEMTKEEIIEWKTKK
jgi:hypothetical protein